MKNLTIILITLIAISCSQNETYKREAWYKINNDSVSDTTLIKEKYYDMNENLLMSIAWNPTNRAYKSVNKYNESKKITESYVYFDTTMQNGQLFSSKFDNGEIVEQTFINIFKDSENDTIVVKQINTFDNNNKLIKSVLVSEEDTNRLTYTYNNKGLGIGV